MKVLFFKTIQDTGVMGSGKKLVLSPTYSTRESINFTAMCLP